MDFSFGERKPFQRSRFGFVTGSIIELVPARTGGRRSDGCTIFAMVEDMDGNTVNFVLTPSTYVVEYETLSVGMRCTFWYDSEAPMPLIYPPQYNAVVAAQERNGRMVDVSYYDAALVNESQTLKLNMDG